MDLTGSNIKNASRRPQARIRDPNDLTQSIHRANQSCHEAAKGALPRGRTAVKPAR